MRKNINSETIIGRLYQHNLVKKQVKDEKSKNYGKDFISGTIDVATDENGLNVITIHYTYVTAMTKNGAKNGTYDILEKIINGAPTWLDNGKDNATKVRVDTSLDLNDFVSRDGEMVSAKRNEGGFVKIVNTLPDEKERNRFTFDMVITSARRIEANEQSNAPEKVALRGAIFNFKNDLLPVELTVLNPDGMNYFEGLEATSSKPVYTKVWGEIVSLTTKIQIEEQSAFGAPSVREVERTTKAWVVTGTSENAYAFGEAEVLTAEELTTAMQNREVHLAEVKKRNEDYLASQSAPQIATMNINTGNFNF